jgi:hypothetical protein
MNDSFIRFVFEGDDASFDAACGADPESARTALRQRPELAFRLLHDDRIEQRLKQLDFKPRDFSREICAAVDSVVARGSGRADRCCAAAARLLCASAMSWAGGGGKWLLLPAMVPADRRSGVIALERGDLSVVSELGPLHLLRLLVDPRSSLLQQSNPWLAELTREAVAAGAAALHPSGIPAVAEFRMLGLHAWCCCAEDDDLAREDLARALGFEPRAVALLRDQVGAAAGADGLWDAPGRIDWGRVSQDPLLERARRWLGIELDRPAIELGMSMREEVPAIADAWVRWAHASALEGASSKRVFSALVDLGEMRKDRERLLGEFWTRGLLEGPGALQALESELPRPGERNDDVEAFAALLEGAMRSGREDGLPPALARWFREAREAYFRSARAVGSLSPIGPELEAVLADPPPALAAVAARIREQRRARERERAESYNRAWMFDLVEHVDRRRSDPDAWDAGRAILIAEDREVLRQLAARMSAPPSGPPWYAIDSGLATEFRMREAAFALGFLKEAEFKEAVRQHALAILGAGNFPADREAELRRLCERCGRLTLGRLKDSQPRSRTMDAFRQGDGRAMLEGEAAPESGAPVDNVPLSPLSPVAVAALAVFAACAIAMASALWLGGSDPDAPRVDRKAATGGGG